MNKDLLLYNLYKTEMHYKKEKIMVYKQFLLLHLNKSGVREHYETLLNRVKAQAKIDETNQNDISTEIQIILAYIGENKGEQDLHQRWQDIFDEYLEIKDNWEVATKEHNKAVIDAGYMPLSISDYRASFGFFELSNGKILLTNL